MANPQPESPAGGACHRADMFKRGVAQVGAGAHPASAGADAVPSRRRFGLAGLNMLDCGDAAAGAPQWPGDPRASVPCGGRGASATTDVKRAAGS